MEPGGELDAMRSETPSVKTHRRRRNGFSLIEVMLALGILSFGILAMMAAQITSMRFSSDSRKHTLAMKLAEDQMETLLTMDPTDVQALILLPGYPGDPSNPIDPNPGDGNPMAFTRRWLITPDSPEVGVIAITVEVDWVNPIGNTITTRLGGLKSSL